MKRHFVAKYISKITIGFAMFAISTFCLGVTAFAEETEAVDLTKKTTVSISGGEDASFLKDQSSSTKKTLKAGTTITVSNDAGIKGIYVIWEQPPGEWQLDVNGSTITYGKYGFIHEYIEFEQSAKSAVIHLPAAGAIIADVSSFSAGKLPDWVQTWIPSYEKADMLVMPTHADDEHLFFGGTMPYYAGELGLKVQVVYLTNHWAEYYRPHELLNGLWEVGIKAYPVMGPFKDLYSTSLLHAQGLYPMESVMAFQVETIRRFKPEVIISQDFKGEYGHGVHMLNATTIAKAVEVSNDPSSYPESAAKYGTWDVPKTYMHLYDQNKITMNWDIPLDSFGGATGFQMADRGFAKHKSQQGYFKMGREGVFNCMAFGLYRSTVGPDSGKNDFLENVSVFRSYAYKRRNNVIPDKIQSVSSVPAVNKGAVNSTK